ncbi:MAG: hypothetical protein HQK75_08100 [Candidatus Magnetomorum sp.]|nr:hypothetical protein [Candidatus Magnetomorum sp.]
MKNMLHAIIGLLILIIFVSIIQATGFAQSLESRKENKLLKRIDFNNAYIMGQSIKSGAVYLLKRKNSDIKSMLNYRVDYRKEILEDFDVPLKTQKQLSSQPLVETEKMFSMDVDFHHDVR